MVLSSIPGVSERMASKMTEHFGSEDAVMSTLASGDIARLAEVEGLSAKRALSLARHYAGDDGQFLATKEARKLHQNLITHLQSYASFPASQERMGLLMPVRNPEQRRGLITAALELDPEWLEQQAKAWQGLRRLREKQERYERVVVSPEPLDALKKHCRVLQPGENESWKDYTVFKTVTWLGPGAPMEAPDGWLVLGSSPDPALVLPERTIDWFVHNKGVLGVLCDLVESQQRNELPENEALASLKEALLPLGKLPEAMNRLSDDSQIEEVARIKDELWSTVKALETTVNEEVERAMNDAKMALSGAELLEALADGTAFQRKLREATGHVIQEAMQAAREELAAFLQPASLRCPFDIFTTSWPAKVDRQTIDGIDAALDSKLKAETTGHLVEMARLLGPMKTPCERAVARLVETDQWLAVARWAHTHGCVMPELVKHGVWLEGGRHLLLGVDPDPVTYGLGAAAVEGDRQSLALLTGANSGGKTTLLECIAYATILAHMGLPVPAQSARIGHVEALHILAKAGGTQSAGALEQTLVELATVVSDPTPKLILADELEAITEPGAGARIIAGMLLAAESQPETTMMLVTHLAPAILEATGRDDLRVDGIEARGLGEDLELLVDRTPRRNHLARSTPELIVKRLVEKSNGHAKALFADILEMFHQRD
ncbi:MAG: MutS-related protein [Poseidonia sp.]